MRIYLTIFFCSVFFLSIQAQQQYSAAEVANIILEESKQELSADDLAGLKIDRQYTNEKTGVTYIYAAQTLNDIPIHNAVASIAIRKDNKYRSVTESFVPGVKNLVKRVSGKLMKAEEAVQSALAKESLVATDLRTETVRSNAEKTVYSSDILTENGAEAKPVYLLVDGEMKLTWDVSFFPKDGTDYWSMRLDASTGALLDKTSFTVHCQFDAPDHSHDHDCSQQHTAAPQSAAMMGDGAQYNVFALPVESPLHGDRTIVSDPSDAEASPHGWHDLNGITGNETTITEGNNAFAWLDRDASYTADREITGGSDLIFDYAYDGLTEPTGYQDAATANLFYMVNMMHDFTYAYGLDGLAGNFQENNYGLGGAGGDAVRALAQFDGDAVGGNNINNADFSTPNDGGAGTMRMFLWNTRNDISVFSVTEPSDVAGPYPSRTANFGRVIDNVALVGDVAIVDDGVGITTDACQGIKNGAAINGKIALIDRGECEFGLKILDAESNGAIGVIICNDDRAMTTMGQGAVGDQVTIPSVMITKGDCAQIRLFVGSGLTVKFQSPDDDDQPAKVDGSLDNGIIAHEYGHGISNRLTGGPNQSNCLSGSSVGAREEGEQMGEGWSDFFALVLTAEPGDAGTDARGIGNYAVRNPIDGNGIRAYPYSTDMSVNPVTYYDTYEASIPHGVGHIWSTILWDMYWLFVDRYGWDADFIRGDKGNNKAIQLVMEGMKLQPCNPGFVDGRDGILAADMMLCNGENQDIIWEAFARRGLGQFADQGESNLVADGKEDYNIPPQYIKSVKLNKSMTPTIDKGENIQVSLEVRNDLGETVNNIQVIDIVPASTQVDMTSLPTGATVSGDQITFVIASLDSATQMTLTYELTTPLIPSKLIAFDDMESPDTDGTSWITNAINGNRFFNWSAGYAYSGTYAWEIANIGAREHDQSVFSFFEVPITGGKPMLRFAHNYSTDAGNDGGIVEISTDYLTTLSDLGGHMIRNGYNNRIRSAGFSDNIEHAFTGTSDGWELSYADLSAFSGEDAFFQFRFGSDANGASDFWSIDDFTVFEARTYNSEACLTFDGATDMVCGEAPEWGTIVEPEEYSSNENQAGIEQYINIYPNPAHDLVSIETQDLTGKAEVTIRDFSGRQIWSRSLDRIQDERRMVVSMTDWSAGMYLVEIANDNQVFTSKVFKK